MRPFLALLLVAGLAPEARAVPAFLQMFKAKYGVRTASCLLCHADHAGGRLNDYGHDFMKAGATFEAFAAIETQDSDGDGATNLEEIRAGSNPGDPSSTPKRPGAWLADTNPADAMPLKGLRKMYPGVTRFDVQEVTLSAADAKAVSDVLGAPLGPGDRYWTLYFPVDESTTTPVRTGVAVFPATALPDGLFTGSLALGADGRVRAASGEISTDLGSDSLKGLARQFVGKSDSDPLTLGKDLTPVRGLAQASAEGAIELRKAMLVVTRVLGAK